MHIIALLLTWPPQSGHFTNAMRSPPRLSGEIDRQITISFETLTDFRRAAPFSNRRAHAYWRNGTEQNEDAVAGNAA